MTTLISWVSYSKTGSEPDTPAALYLVSDSRISWGPSSMRWDAGRKVFAPISRPHMFGYFGAVLLPALALGQIVDLINQGALSDDDDQLAFEVESLLALSASRQSNAPLGDFTIVHAYRRGSGRNTRFVVRCLAYKSGSSSWKYSHVFVPTDTDVVVELGSGAAASRLNRKAWDASDSGGLSRAVFSAFVDALRSQKDRFTGGEPQGVAIYKNGAPKLLGFSDRGRLFLNGLQIQPALNSQGIEWIDKLFQRVDPATGKAKQGTRRFGRPTSLSKSAASNEV